MEREVERNAIKALQTQLFICRQWDNKLEANKISCGYSQFHFKKQTLASQADSEIWAIDESRLKQRWAKMTRQDNAVPSPSVNWTEQWPQNQVNYISGFLQKMVSKAEIHSGRNYSIKSRGQRYNCLNRERFWFYRFVKWLFSMKETWGKIKRRVIWDIENVIGG